MNRTKENTMFNRKILSLLILAVFAVQSCNQAITPTKGVSDLTGDSSDSEIAGSVTAAYCLLGDDQDTDGDGICDKEDTSADETVDCSTDASCAAHQDKGPWITRVALPALGVLGALVSAAAITEWATTGDFWFNKEVDGDGLFKVSKDESNNFTFTTSESWPLVGNTPHSKIRIEATALRGYDLTELGGDKIAKGRKFIFCANGALGTVTPVTTDIPGQYKVDATITYGKSYLTDFVVANGNVNGKNLSLDEFNSKCDFGGVWLGMENDHGYFTTAVDTKLLTGEKNNATGAVDLTYLIDALPASVDSNHVFKIQRANRLNNLLKTIHYDLNLDDDTQLHAYNYGGDNNLGSTITERAQALFGEYEGEATPVANGNVSDVSVVSNNAKSSAVSSDYWINDL